MRILKENIISFDLPPGTSLSDTEVSHAVGLSRAPVREAIAELAQIRIIDVKPHKSNVVSMIDPETVENAISLRKMFECSLIQSVCCAMPDECLERLGENVRLQYFYLESRNDEKLKSLFDQFHMSLAVCAKKVTSCLIIRDFFIHAEKYTVCFLTILRKAFENMKDFSRQ